MESLIKKYINFWFVIVTVLISGCATGPNIETIRNWNIPENSNLVNGELENGFKYSVYSSDKLSKDFIDLRLIINVGSSSETETEFGYAHLVEHMVFRNTESYPAGKINTIFNQMGASLGHDYNAFTSSDYTFYKLRIPANDSENLEKAIDVLVELSSKAQFQEKDLQIEKRIVLEEKLIRLGEENSVDKKVKRKITQIVDKNYHFPIGQTDSILRASVDSLQSFYDRWYQPENMHLVIAGNLQTDRITKTISARFSQKPKSGNNAPKINPVNLSNLKQKTFYISSAGEDRHKDFVNVLYLNSRYNVNKFSELEPLFAESIALDIFLAKLNLLAKKKNLPLSFSVDSPIYFTDLDVTRLLGFVRNGNYLDLLEIYNTVTSNILQNGISEDEFLGYRQGFSERIGNQWYEFHTLKSDRIADIMTSNVIEGVKPVLFSGSYYNVAIKLIRQISLEQVDSAFRRLNSQPKVVSIEANNQRLDRLPDMAESKIIFENSNPVTDQLNLNVTDNIKNRDSIYDRINSISPKPKKIKSVDKDEVLGLNKFVLANGYQVFHRQTKIDEGQFYIQLISPTGTLHSIDIKSLENAYITAQLINAHRLGVFLGSEFSQKLNASGEAPLLLSYLNNYQHGLNLKAKRSFIEFYFRLIKYLWSEPLNISQTWFNQMLSTLKQEMVDYRLTKANDYYSQIYSHMYSNQPGVWLPDASAYESFQISDLQKSLDSIFLTNDFYLMIVGDISDNEVKDLAEKYLSDLPQYQYKSSEQITVKMTRPVQSARINVAGSNESKSFLEMTYINHSHYSKDQRPSVLIARGILYNRLQEKIREDRGLIYSLNVNSDRIHYHDSSDITKISFTTSLPNKQKVEVLVDKELEKLMNGDFTLDELNQAKLILKQNILEGLSSNEGWAQAFSSSMLREGQLAKSEYYINPDIWLDLVTLEDVKSAFNLLFNGSIKIAAAYDPK